MIRNLISTALFVAGSFAAGVYSTSVHAQAFGSGIDKPVPRMCTKSCVQSSEQMVVDGNGNAVAMWNEPYSDGFETYGSLVGARYTASTNSWSAPVRLWYSYMGTPGGKLEMDAAGNATLLFSLNMGYGKSDYQMTAVRWIAGYGWQTSGVTTEYGWEPNSGKAVSVGRGGHIVGTYGVSFNGRGELPSEARTVVYSPATKTWTMLKTPTNAVFDKVVTDPYGSALGFHYKSGQIVTKRFDAATRTWAGIPGAIEPAGNFTITQFEAASDRAGNIMVLYEKHDYATNTRQVKSARYQASTRSWSRKTVPVISSSRLYGAPSLAADRFNNFYATWVQYSGAYTKTIAARYSNSAAVWSKPVVISRGSYHTRDAAVAVDYAGNAIYTWGQRTDTGTGSSTGKIFRTTAVRYSNWTWGTPMIIQDANRIGYKPFIGADNSGRAIVMWTQDSSVTGIKEIRSDRLTPK